MILKRNLLTILSVLLTSVFYYANAQTTGTVFRDYNGNGTRQNVSNSFVEPTVAGVIVNVFNSSDVLVASYKSGSDGTFSIPTSGTAYNGVQGSNTGFVANSTNIRLEFVIPDNLTSCGHLRTGVDYPSVAGFTHGTSVRFITSGTSGNNFAINTPGEYIADTTSASNTLYLARQTFGNPTASGTGNVKDTAVFYKLAYNASGGPTFPASSILANFSQIGTVMGVAYSKQANRIFTSAYMKRHAGFGPADGNTNHAPGAIYIINPSLSSTSNPVAASFFVSLDALGYPTHNSKGSPAYGAGTSYNITNNGLSGTSLEQTINYIGEGWGVIGTNAQRGLALAAGTPTNDPAAFDQVGKVSIGDIEISEDGKYLYVTNLYDRRIYQLELNSVTNPTAATVVQSWALPNPPLRSQSGIPLANQTYYGSYDNTDFYTGERGYNRPFALKFYRGKLYIGSVTTGEGPKGVSMDDDNIGSPEYTDIWSYIWELDPESGDFASSPLLQMPMNFYRGLNGDGAEENFQPWGNTLISPTLDGLNLIGHAQPIFSDIEFDVDGTMILGFRDRNGDQLGEDNYMLSGTTELRSAWVYGDILRAYYNPNTCAYESEYNGKEGPNSSKASTLGAFNNQGPGGGEFYFEDGMERLNGVPGTGVAHVNCGMGSLALFPGKNEVIATQMDPYAFWTGGISVFNNTTGYNTRDVSIYYGETVNSLGKANGMGDIELFAQSAPIEIGNRVWYDADLDGIQDAGESGIANVTVDLYSNGPDGIPGNSDDVLLGSTTTISSGSYFFTTASGSDGSGVDYGVLLTVNTSYNIRIGAADWNASGKAGTGDLASRELTKVNIQGNGDTDKSDNDALLNGNNFPMISFTTGESGESNHSLDFGFSPVYATVGNRVWFDQNSNGVFDEESSFGLNNVTVELYKESSPNSGVFNLFSSQLTANDSLGNPGYYLFYTPDAANYRIRFYNAGSTYTSQTATAGMDNVSDPNPADGFSPIFALNPSGTGLSKYNPTIDAGLKVIEIGNYVWMDSDADGVQDAGEDGISSVILELYDQSGNPVVVCLNENAATNFGSESDNDGTVNFGSDWTISGTGSSIVSGEMRILGVSGSGSRDVTKPAYFTVDTVKVSFDLKQSGLSGGETFLVDYHNGSSWVNMATLTSSEILAEFSSFEYTSVSIPGLLNIDSIRFREGSYADADFVTIDNLVIQFKKACANARDTTDANGKYSFNLQQHGLLASTQYQVRIAESQDSIVHYSVTSTGAGTSATDNNGTDAGSYVTTGNISSPASGADSTFDFGFIGYSVGNQVWSDADNDGTLDAGEVGISGVTMALLNVDGSLRATTTTDIDGRYYFYGLPAGQYQVAVTSSLTSGVLNGMTIPTTTTTADVDNNNNGNAVNPNSNPAAVTFSSISEVFTLGTKSEPTNESNEDPIGTQPDNQSNLTIDFGFYRLAIGDYVWLDNDADGVQDGNESGIAGVLVELYNNAGSLVYKGCNTDNNATDFSSSSHNSGSLNFNGNWTFAGTNTGINTSALRVYGTTGSTATRNITRPVGYTIDTVTVSFTGSEVGLLETEALLIEYNNGSGWVTLDVLYGEISGSTAGGLRAAAKTFTFSSANYPGLSSITGIRFRENPTTPYADADYVIIDNLSIRFGAACVAQRVTTDANGKYTFNSGDHNLLASTTYQVRIPAAQEALNDLYITTTGQGTTSTDNNGTLVNLHYTTGNITTPASGQNMTYDFGFVPLKIGDYVWLDADGDGIQDSNERGIGGVVVDVYRTNGVQLKGNCGPDSLVTNFTFNDDNAGSINFSNWWVSSTAMGTLLASNRLNMTDALDASRMFSLAAIDSITSVTVYYSAQEGAGTISDNEGITVQYYNGTSWVSFDTILGSEINNSSYSVLSKTSAQVSGLRTMSGIRFIENIAQNSLDGGDAIWIEDLKIVFSGRCNVSATTDQNGYYSFGSTDGVLQGGQYQLRISESQDSTSSLVVTTTGQGTTETDNNGTDGGAYTTSGNITAPSSGQNLSFDFGFMGYSVGNLVWWDSDNDGIKDGGESGISGVTVGLINRQGILENTTTTDNDGKYYFGGLMPGYYQVVILSLQDEGVLDGASLSSVTTRTADVDNNNNGGTTDTAEVWSGEFSAISEAFYLGGSAEMTTETDEDPVTGQADNRSNLSVDFGFYRVSIGDRVWMDKDADGIQDAGERGIGGVLVNLIYSGVDTVVVDCQATFATNMTNASHNSGTNNFAGDWTLNSGASISGGEVLIGSSDTARRAFTIPSGFNDTVIVSFGLRKNASVDAGDELRVEYHNGSAWVLLDAITGTEITSTVSLTTFTYNTTTVPGLANAREIRFGEQSGIGAGETVYVDDLFIYTVNQACSSNYNNYQDTFSTTTDNDGYYRFSNYEHGISPSTNYVIQLPKAQDSLTGLGITSTGQGNSSTDNNGTDGGAFITSGTITTPASSDNSTFDFGFIGYSIGNQVWWDNDNDGVKDGGEIGISGVEISLLNSLGEEVGTTTTDAQGKYYFHGLTGGNYQVAVTSSLISGVLQGATVSTTIVTTDVDNNNNGSATNPQGAGASSVFFSSISDVINLGSSNEPTNETDEDPFTNQPDNASNLAVDFGFTPPQTAVGNLVFGDLNNNGVYDAGDTTMDNVWVYLYRDLNDDGTPETVTDSTLTADGGYYEFLGIGAGIFRIEVASRSFNSGQPLAGSTATTNGSSGNSTTDNNSEGQLSGIFTLLPMNQPTGDSGDEDIETLQGVSILDANANFTFDFGFFGGAVPVTWLTFDVKLDVNQEDGIIKWSTASELNNDYFEVQRSIDGRNFEVVGLVATQALEGNSNEVLNYSFMDPKVHLLNRNVIYYRLRQVDRDGKYDYSDVKFITLQTNNRISVYPNPTRNVLNITWDNNAPTEIQLTDIAGKVIQSANEINGVNQMTFDLNTLPAGTYYVRFIQDGLIKTEKVVKY